MVMHSEMAQQLIDSKVDDGAVVDEAEMSAAEKKLEDVQSALRSLRTKLSRTIRVAQNRDNSRAKAAQDLIEARIKVHA